MERTNKAKTRYIAQLGLFIGIILLMELTGLTKIPIGPGLNMTFSMIPIAVGAMLLGPLAGTILGGVYGLTSLYNAITGTGGMTFMFSNSSRRSARSRTAAAIRRRSRSTCANSRRPAG